MNTLLELAVHSFLPELIWKVTVLVALAGILTLGMRRASGAQRHLVWMLCLVGVLVLPLLALVLPRWRLPVLPTSRTAPQSASEPISRVPTTSVPHIIFSEPVRREGEDRSITVERETPASPVSPAPPVSAQANNEHRSTRWQGMGLLVGGLWLLGAVLTGSVVVHRMHLLARLQRTCLPCTDTNLHATVRQLAQAQKVNRPVCLLLQPEDAKPLPPMTWGWKRPVILLPSAAIRWPQEQLRGVLLHEMAHVRRGDWLVQIMAQGVCVLYWFHPLVWWAARRMRQEAERASDDSVLCTGFPPKPMRISYWR